MYNEHYFESEYDYDCEPVIYSGALKHICENLEVVLSELYGNKPIDLSLLENALDEVANGLGMHLPINDLMIERSRKLNTSFSHSFYDTNLCQKVVA